MLSMTQSATVNGGREAGNTHVLLLALVEASDSLDRHIVGLGSARSEDYILGIRTNELRDVL